MKFFQNWSHAWVIQVPLCDKHFKTRMDNTHITWFSSKIIVMLQSLHELGARKFVLMAINPNGCSPFATTRVPTQEGCVENLNKASLMFNANLKNLVDDIRPQMPGSNLVFVNTYKILSDIITFPTSQGIYLLTLLSFWKYLLFNIFIKAKSSTLYQVITDLAHAVFMELNILDLDP